MMKRLCVLIVCCVVFSCIKQKETSINNTQENKEVAIKEINNQTKQNKFNYHTFSSFLDETFKNSNDKNLFDVSIDTLKLSMIPDDLRDISIWSDLINKSDQMIEYSFNNKKVTIDLYILSNSSHNNTKNCFDYLEGLAFNKKNDLHKGPGISYENDYVFMYDNNVFWLNSPCLVSYKNHLILSRYLNKMIIPKSEKAIDELFCKCGKVLCEDKDEN